jgi:hypothetical protein
MAARRWAFVVVVATIGLITFPSRGQYGAAADAITGTGTAVIKKTPEVMRMQIQLSADGKSLKDALTKLSQRKEAAKKKLANLAAAEQSITFDDVRPELADPRQAMERMMRQRMGARTSRSPTTGPGAAGAAMNVKVVVTLKAEWPLSGKSPEELLLVSHELQDKIKAADLADMKTASLEEQELREEQAGNEYGQQGPAPGEPAFLFVARISPDDRSKAMADAFNKAKANAHELAKAAGAHLGGLKQMSGQASVDTSQYQQMVQYRYMQYGQIHEGYGASPDGEQGEAIGMQPGSVIMRVAVSASFGIK